MRKIIMLAFSNIRKAKGNSFCLLCMFFISAFLFNAGLLVYFNFGSFFQSIVDELNTSNIYYFIPEANFTNDVEALFKNDNVLDYEKVSAIRVLATETYKGEIHEQVFVINNADVNRRLSKWKFVGSHLPADSEKSIYLPNIYHIDGGYDLNDKFEVEIAGKVMTFTIKGFTEDVYFSSLDTGFMGIYLPPDTFEKVNDAIADSYNTAIVFANLKKINKSLESDIRKVTGIDSSYLVTNIELSIFSRDIDIVKLSRVLMSSAVSSMIVAFATIITVVCLIVVRFRIINSIEDDMTKIGSLKAMGYTGKQIVLSIVVQFLLIAVIGTVIGIGVSYASVPILSDVFSQQSGLVWIQGFDPVVSTITILFMIIVVCITSFVASRRINKLNPIVALRGGLNTHSFHRNHIPLSKTRGQLSFVLALKMFFHNLKQSIMITIIIFAVSCAGTFAVIMFYNTTIDTSMFKKTPGIELCNAQAFLKPEENVMKITESIKNTDGVRKVMFNDEVMVNIDGNDILTYLYEDFLEKETYSVYLGRYPRHDNEIVLAGHLADILDKGVGDVVIINENEYIITGLSQGTALGGINASLRYDGYYKVNPGFVKSKLNIYLNEGVSTAAFVEQLKAEYGGLIESVVDVDKMIELSMGIYTSIVTKVGIVIFVVTMSVIVLVLYFVISSNFIRKKREFGIQKAIGYTTFQLMNQVSLSFLFPVIAGVASGCIVGMTRTNALMSMVQRSMGIMKAEYIIQPMWIFIFGVIVVVVSYITSMLVSFSIRKVSAYSLVSY